VASQTPVLANRVRATMGAIFKWAITENIVAPERNPVSGKEKREALNAWGTRLSRIVSSLEVAKAERSEA